MMKDLLIVGGHAIYQGGKWYGGFPGEDKFYEQHVEDALRIRDKKKYKYLAFSGGCTRPDLIEVEKGSVTNSEAKGMLEFVLYENRRRLNKILPQGFKGYADKSFILLEEFARDSFENVFFSMLRFFQHTGKWPREVGVVSWKFKALRFYLIACGLHLGNGRFEFFGSGDPDLQSTIETVAVANATYDASMVVTSQGLGTENILDPLHRGSAFVRKRLGRMLRRFSNDDYLAEVKKAYDNNFNLQLARQGAVGEAIDTVEGLQPGICWRNAPWPWDH